MFLRSKPIEKDFARWIAAASMEEVIEVDQEVECVDVAPQWF